MDALPLCQMDYTDRCVDVANMPVATQKYLKGFSQTSVSLHAGELLPEMSQQREDHNALVQ